MADSTVHRWPEAWLWPEGCSLFARKLPHVVHEEIVDGRAILTASMDDHWTMPRCDVLHRWEGKASAQIAWGLLPTAWQADVLQRYRTQMRLHDRRLSIEDMIDQRRLIGNEIRDWFHSARGKTLRADLSEEQAQRAARRWAINNPMRLMECGRSGICREIPTETRPVLTARPRQKPAPNRVMQTTPTDAEDLFR